MGAVDAVPGGSVQRFCCTECGGHSIIEKRYVATIGVCWHHHVVSDCEVGCFGGAGRQVIAPRSNRA